MSKNGAAPQGIRQIRVLIIDDEPDLVATLSMRFAALGAFAVETALDGEAGLGKVKDFRPDVVLLDQVMPAVDGWEVCRRLRADPATLHLPVVMMTAHPAAETEAMAAAAGIHRVLFKPFDIHKLVETLLDALPTLG